MIFLTVFFYVVASIYCIYEGKKKGFALNLRHISIYVLTAIIFFNSLRFYNIPEISVKTNALLLLFLIGLLCGNGKISVKRRTRNCSYSFRIKTYDILCLIMFVSLLFYLERYFAQVALGMTASELRKDIAGFVFSGEYDYLFYWLFLSPMSFVVYCVACTEFFWGKKSIIRFLFNVSIIMLYALLTGGRALIVVFGITLFVGFLIKKKWTNQNIGYYVDINENMGGQTKSKLKKYAPVVFFSIVIIFLMVANITTSRDTRDLGEIFYQYFALCISNLDERIKIIDDNKVVTWGLASGRGIAEIIVLLIERIGINLRTGVYALMQQWFTAIEKSITIGDLWINAFVTPIYYFYLDLRYLGVILGGWTFGTICTKATDCMAIKHDSYHISVFFLVLYSALTIMVRWQFWLVQYILAFVFLRLLFKKQSV